MISQKNSKRYNINFRKIDAKDPIFIKTKELYKKEYEHFLAFSDSITRDGNKNKKKSGKARSYADYLIRLVILYNESNADKIENLLVFNSLKELGEILVNPNFNKYNENENRFPNASFNYFIAFITALNNDKDHFIDFQLNKEIDSELFINTQNTGNILDGPQTKVKQVKLGNVLTYPRNPIESLEAKRRSHWECELDPKHKTFISVSSKKPYMEAHHLIPMAAQDFFENTLDFADNILCLCPNCHRKIHLAERDIKKEIILALFNLRAYKYQKYEINISKKKQLLRYYDVL